MHVNYEISIVSQIFKIQLFFHFVKFELLIEDFTFSVVNPIFVQKYIVLDQVYCTNKYFSFSPI